MSEFAGQPEVEGTPVSLPESVEAELVEAGTVQPGAVEYVTVKPSPVVHAYGEPPSTPLREGAQLSLFAMVPDGTGDIQVPPPLPTVDRHPNLADVAILFALLTMSTFVSSGALGVIAYFHLFGIRSFDALKYNTGLGLALELMIYVVALTAAIPIFRSAWQTKFFKGVHWNSATAFRMRGRLVGAALFANVLSFLGGLLVPSPKDSPIEKMFSSPANAWMLFAFGVTVAPFFEELLFRGFLLPAIATSWDWCRERFTGTRPHPLDAGGNPVWSMPAMVCAALVASMPFALIHAPQVAWSWGALALLYCVSLVLSAVRLTTRSLAASTIVHSAYNSLIFLLMLVQTGGFRHFDKM